MSEREKKERRVIYHTPIGESGFCALTEPSTKFNKNGVYQAQLFLDKDKAAPLLEKLQVEYEKAVSEGEAKWKKEKRSVREECPFKTNRYYRAEYDDSEQETGRVQFSFKRVASGTTQEGKAWRKTIPIYDRFGKIVQNTQDLRIFSGSVLVISFSVVPYYVAATGCGITLQIEAVQLLKAASGDVRAASYYGFSAVEGIDGDETCGDESSFGNDSAGANDGDY